MNNKRFKLNHFSRRIVRVAKFSRKLIRKFIQANNLKNIMILGDSDVDRVLRDKLYGQNIWQITDNHTHNLVKEAKKNKVNLFISLSNTKNAHLLKDFRKAGIPAIGVTEKWAKLELYKTSKSFMQKYNISTPKYSVISNIEQFENEIKNFCFPVMIKSDKTEYFNNMSFKADNYQSAQSYARELLDKVGKNSSGNVVIEEFINNCEKEIRLYHLWDGKVLLNLSPLRYHTKRFSTGEAYCLGACFDQLVEKFFQKQIKIYSSLLQKALKKEKSDFRGIIRSDIILNSYGYNVLKYKMGLSLDEEGMLFKHLETDPMKIFESLIKQKLNELKLKYKKNIIASVSIVHSGCFDSNNCEIEKPSICISKSNVEFLENKGIKVCFNSIDFDGEYYWSKKPILCRLERASEHPFADIYTALEEIDLPNLSYYKKIGYPVIYSSAFCQKLQPEEYVKYLKKIYYQHFEKELNLQNPQLFTEKIQWLKLYDSTSLKTMLTDKILVKNYIREKVPDLNITKTYAVWNCASDIDLKSLPNSFILKTNHACGNHIKIYDKKTFLKDKVKVEKIKKLFNSLLKIKWGFTSAFELHYNDIIPMVYAEELIFEKTKTSVPMDYKIHCFNGKPQFIEYYIQDKGLVYMVITDTSWKRQDVYYNTMPYTKDDLAEPKNLKLMIEIAEKLSEGFKYVRVDLFEYCDLLYFAEMTFTPNSGFMKFTPEKYDRIFGDMLCLD